MRTTPLDALKRAIPYLKLFRDKLFVVKLGGEALESPETARPILEQIATLHTLGIRMVVVHGGGPQASALSAQLGAEPVKIEGRRVTDETALKAMIMTLNGEVQATILSACRSLDIPAVGISGVDSGLVKVKKRAPMKMRDGSTADFGYVGDVQSIDPSVINDLLRDGYLPIVSPLAADETGQILNTNADTVAAELAIALGAVKLMLVTGATGILRDPKHPSSLIAYLDLEELQVLDEEGSLKDGMLPKATAIRRALEGGVARVHIVGYKTPDCLLLEVLTNQGCGTLVVASREILTPEEDYLKK
jgi:acetylglutamate kinase